MKECTGHKSDAVDKYQLTSDEQRQKLCEIISNESNCEVKEVSDMVNKENIEPNVSKVVCETASTAPLNETVNVQSDDVVPLITNIVNATKNGRKSVIKINIEIINE